MPSLKIGRGSATLPQRKGQETNRLMQTIAIAIGWSGTVAVLTIYL
jgi:hypothetical protein